MRNKLLMVLILCLPVAAQEVNIVELLPADQQEAQSIVAAEKRLEIRKLNFKSRLIHNYIEASSGGGCVVDRMVVRPEWGCAEFQISADGRFITPIANPTKSSYEFFEVKDGSVREVSPKGTDAEGYYIVYVPEGMSVSPVH